MIKYYVLTCLKPTGNFTINGLPFLKEEIYLETEKDYKIIWKFVE